MSAFDAETIHAKYLAGIPLNPYESRIHRLTYRPDGTRYSANPRVRDRQYNADIRAERRARRHSRGI